tara:strand:+ start:45 stop:512 length:468 start_codon:yes stop_codon:yes gene_type:complete
LDKENFLVKKLISLLLISVCLGDILILKDKTVYTGALIKFGTDEIIFKAIPSAKLSIYISDIQELKLSDGTKVFENGIKVATNEKYIENTGYDRYLFVSRAEKYKNSAERAKERKSIYVSCCLIIILFGFLVVKDIGSNFGSGFPDGPWPGDGHP